MFFIKYFARKTIPMDPLNEKLITAVNAGRLEEVASLLEEGADMNKVCSSGRTALGVAAQMGCTVLLKIMLDFQKASKNCSPTEMPLENTDIPKHKVKHKKRKDQSHNYNRHSVKDSWKSNFLQQVLREDQDQCIRNVAPPNLGYFTMVHGYGDSTTSSVASYSDENENKGVNNIKNLPSEMNDVSTPDGMEHLEWDTEMDDKKDELNESSQDEDVWATLYRWYADILEKTGSYLSAVPDCGFNRPDAYGRTAAHYAAEHGHIDILQLLHEAGCRMDCIDLQAMAPLHLAVCKGQHEVAKMLLDIGVEVNSKTSDKTSALHIAASRGFLDLTKLLIDGGANIDSLDSSDRTPLMLAVSRNHEDIVEYLIKCGAKINTEEIHGYTPLWEAVFQKNLTTARMLLAAGAKVTHSHHLLHFAVLHRHFEMVEVLLEAGCIVNLRDDCGNTPLAIATQTGHHQIAELLLKKGAGVNSGNAVNGYTPLHEAAQLTNFTKFQKMFYLLREYGAKLNVQSYTPNDTPLFQALLANNLHGAALMIRHGIDVNSSNRDSVVVNILYLACQKNNLAIVKLLVYAGFNIQGHSMLQNLASTDLETVPGWLTYMRKNPMSLMELSRIVVRKRFGEDVYKCVNSMCLPRQIKTYLLLEDIVLE